MQQRIQMIFQDPFSSLNPRMTTIDTIIEPLKIHKLSGGAEREEKVYEIMNTVGLSERFVNSYPHELDGGRRQRIGIARALALNPEFFVCDEPVSALDVSVQAQILNLLKTLQQRFGYTYMFITHDLAVVKHISHEVLVMYLGEMVEKAPTQELFKNPRHPYTKALMSAIPAPSIHNKKERILLEGELTSPIDPKPACRFAPRCESATEQCRRQAPGVTDLGEGHSVRCFLEEK
jgi:peptide/nickel transport system ATP-binding protein